MALPGMTSINKHTDKYICYRDDKICKKKQLLYIVSLTSPLYKMI